ncbi:hypothetical protein E2562_036185 [Oryza meyeriana var. granulata]|uniref:DNA repair metallo-beta-lactamase domain-containing protein n=1 Tax=Oryza meyeriana var. granulata TaxID=110450 RepID=A0A6G1E7I8_9ORYZ|nr:hypothetical protein E2562_036185 [Oryza meyeriana var. granulata]
MPIEMPRGLPFAVDTWGPSSRRRRHRFLTHAHRDHLVGAASGEGPGAVYATRLTMALALCHFPQLEKGEFVEMEVGKTVVVDDPTGAFSVTAYDANHCPVQEPDITLFGRARFGSEEIDIMKEELCNQCIAAEEARNLKMRSLLVSVLHPQGN